MQLYKIGLLRYETPFAEQGELHMGFTTEQDCREWVVVNNQLALDYAGLPLYCFLGSL